jgi:hypothetical protein
MPAGGLRDFLGEGRRGEEFQMSINNDQDVIDQVTRVGQIMAIGLIVGAAVLLGIAIAFNPMGGAANGAMEVGVILTWVAVVFAAILLPMSVIIPGLVTRQQRRNIAAGKWTPPFNPKARGSASGAETSQSDTGKLAFVYQNQFIIGAALNESPTFFAAIAYMIGRESLALGLACVLLLALALRFPTRTRVASWIDRQQELLIQDRQAGG